MSELIIDLGYGGEESIRDEEIISVAYVFKDHEEFNNIAAHMKKHNFEQHLYLSKPYPVDVIAFEAMHKIVDGQLTIPEDWEQPLDSRGDN